MSVKFEFWTNSNDQCGAKCGFQLEFVKSYKGVAHLSRRAIANILPTTLLGIVPFLLSKRCKSQYINHGSDFSKAYGGRDVVKQNLRQACAFRVANESG